MRMVLEEGRVGKAYCSLCYEGEVIIRNGSFECNSCLEKIIIKEVKEK